MLQCADPVDQSAAMLHDAIEDTELTLDHLRDAGYRSDVVAAIDALTKRTQESHEQYIDRVAGNAVACRVKIADIEENLANNLRSPSAPGNAERIRRYGAALVQLRAV
jgi:(p)ppGpp synthase/HD superfamily hydrolase